MRLFVLPALAAAAMAASPAGAEGALRIWPVKGLYGLEATSCKRSPTADPSQDTAKIHPAFCEMVTVPERQRFGLLFVEAVSNRFSDVDTDLAAGAPAGTTPEAKLAGTLIASLHLTRADLWTVDKGRAVDVYVPLTLTLNLTNAATGEVLFTQSRSVIPEGRFSADDPVAPAKAQFRGHVDAAIHDLVDQAASAYKPYPLRGQIRAKIGDRFVLDKGRSAGLREGDFLGPDTKVVFADAAYSIVEPLLGSLSVGKYLERQVAQPVEMLAKPTALVVVTDAPDSLSRAYLAQLFEDSIGSSARIATMPVNASFAQLREIAVGAAGAGSALTGQRNLPDYFVRMRVIALEPTSVRSNLPGVRLDTHEAHVLIEILDRSGRVVFAGREHDRIIDEVSAGIAFSDDQRRDTAVKNAITKAARLVAASFKPQRLRLPVEDAGTLTRVADEGGALGIGTQGLVLRKASGVAGIQGDIWVPIAPHEVVSVDGGGAVIRSSDPLAGQPRRGDVFGFDSGAQAIVSRRTVTRCGGLPNSIAAPGGQQALTLLTAISENSFAAKFPAPVFIAGFDTAAEERMSQFAARETMGALHAREPDLCFNPVVKVDAAGEKKSGGGLVALLYDITAGFTLHQGLAKVAGSGLQSRLTAGALPQDVDPVARTNSVLRDLALETGNLSAKSAADMKPPL